MYIHPKECSVGLWYKKFKSQQSHCNFDKTPWNQSTLYHLFSKFHFLAISKIDDLGFSIMADSYQLFVAWETSVSCELWIIWSCTDRTQKKELRISSIHIYTSPKNVVGDPVRVDPSLPSTIVTGYHSLPTISAIVLENTQNLAWKSRMWMLKLVNVVRKIDAQYCGLSMHWECRSIFPATAS